MVSVTDQKNSANNQTLVNDVNSKILQRTQNGTTIRSLVVNGDLTTPASISVPNQLPLHFPG